MRSGRHVVRVAAIVLAAGASTRLGSPKQLAMLGEETLLERAIKTVKLAGCSPVVVVLGASAGEIQTGCSLADAVVLVNNDWAEGMGSSIRVGVATLQDVDGCIVTTCDMPAVTVEHLHRLMRSGLELMASSYAGRQGVPAYFPASSFAALKQLQGHVGARDMLRSARCTELAGGELDVDTVEDLERARQLFG